MRSHRCPLTFLKSLPKKVMAVLQFWPSSATAEDLIAPLKKCLRSPSSYTMTYSSRSKHRRKAHVRYSTHTKMEATDDLSSSPALPTQSATPEISQQGSSSQEKEEADEEIDDKQQDEEYLFSCRCDSAKAVASLLSCLTISEKKNSLQPVTVFCTPTALTFHVFGTTAKQSQASVDMSKSLFCDYQVQEGEFCVNLTSVLECLSILAHHLERTKLCWAYCPSSQTFDMELLEEGGVLSTAAIPGLLPPTAPSKSLALAFSQSPIVSRILLKSEWLKQAWTELEHVPGATTCTVAVSNKALQLATVGHAGECVVSLPATPANQGTTLLSLECSSTNTTTTTPRSYPWSSFRLGMRGLDIAEETCLTINEAGMMAIQHQVIDNVNDGEANFVDFLMACLENDEEEQEEQPNVPQPLSLGWKSQDEEKGYSESDIDEEDAVLPISAAPLFGTIVAEDASVATGSIRDVRRRRQQPTSRNSIEVDSSQGDDDEEEEPLDVTASVTPIRRRRRRRNGRNQHGEEGASSPEIEYGEDE